jgi:hypothetical protein
MIISRSDGSRFLYTFFVFLSSLLTSGYSLRIPRVCTYVLIGHLVGFNILDTLTTYFILISL